jgi:orotate phosphoribosyltransferase-like protein
MKAEKKPEFVELRASGLSLAKIAERLSVSNFLPSFALKRKAKEVSKKSL